MLALIRPAVQILAVQNPLTEFRFRGGGERERDCLRARGKPQVFIKFLKQGK